MKQEKEKLVLVDNKFEGARRSTCKEATELLNKGKVRKVLFRPDGMITYEDPDNDMAFIWLEE